MTYWSAAGVDGVVTTFTGYLKDRVYDNIPPTIPDLKATITTAMRVIPRDGCGVLAAPGADLELVFLALIEQKVFVLQIQHFESS